MTIPADPRGAAHWSLMPEPLAWLIGGDRAHRAAVKSRLVQGLVVLNLVFGTRYVAWRAVASVNWDLWPLGLALLSAELFSYTDSLLFGMNMWRVRQRGEPPSAQPGLAVDVFVTTYDEDVAMVLRTAVAARDLRYPHRTFVLDDGDRPAMREACEQEGVGYLIRGAAWAGRARHAKAGNLISALYQTSGEFLLVLDADHVPKPELLDRVLGYFRDPNVAFVQTPQWFANTPDRDPFGSDSPLFYGPIQAGKDGWNSAFFCGSNAVLRREALMQIGVVWYARGVERRARRALRAAIPRLRRARRRSRGHPEGQRAVDEVLALVAVASRSLEAGEPLQSITWRFQAEVERVQRSLDPEALTRIGLELSELSDLAMREILVDRPEEAEPVLPLSTVSLTEDMATAMRLHGLGWTSVYHHEVLAVGLAPEDLHAALTQRLRWAQGTLQVLLAENPLVQPGLTLPQRLLYFGTMWSYLSGFAAVVYLLAPVLYLLFGLTPVQAWSTEFLGYLLPWLVVNQLLFTLIGWGLPTWRGQQYSLALFPLWIEAVRTAVGNVYFGKKLGFVVTPKTRRAGHQFRLVRPQLVVMALLVVAILVGTVRLGLEGTSDRGAILINVLWASYDLAMVGVVLVAATWRPPSGQNAQ